MKDKTKKKKDSWLSVILLSILLVITLFVTNFVARPVIVHESSMEDNLFEGNILLLYMWQYEPKHGDIVVVDEGNSEGKRLIKRLIGLGGDQIKIVDGTVYLNGEKLEEPYISESNQDFSVNLELTIPEGQVYVMGDNRRVSLDSRSIGPIDEELLMGKTTVKMYPW